MFLTVWFSPAAWQLSCLIDDPAVKHISPTCSFSSLFLCSCSFLLSFLKSLIPLMSVDQWRCLTALQHFWIINWVFYRVVWTFFPRLAVPLGSYFSWLFDVLAQVSNKRRVRVEMLTDRMNWQDNLEAEWQKWYSHILGLPRQRHFEAKLYYHIIYIIELDDGLMVSADICNKVANEVVSLRQIPPGH